MLAIGLFFEPVFKKAIINPSGIQTMSLQKRGLLLTFSGLALSLSALLTYFTVIPSWPDLRDSGLLNVAAGGLGLLLSLLGAASCFQARRWRVTGLLAALLSGLAAFSLPIYIYRLSYQLPPAERAIQAGAPAPDFRLGDQEGRERALSEFSGKKIVLVFFRRHW